MTDDEKAVFRKLRRAELDGKEKVVLTAMEVTSLLNYKQRQQEDS